MTLWGGKLRGVIFGVDQDGANYRILHTFQGVADNGGDWPRCRLLEGSDGALYGTTILGGLRSAPGGSIVGGGTVFRINRDGSDYRVIHYETETLISGLSRTLVESEDGLIWGATERGVFCVDKAGGSHREFPQACRSYAGLILGTDRNLYGISSGPFRFEPDLGRFTVMYPFAAGGPSSVERTPRAPLVQGRSGTIYGTTEVGGLTNFGTVFTMETNRAAFRVVNSLGTNGPASGRGPNGLAEGTNGYLYGTTQSGGSNGFGVIFRLDSKGGAYANLHHFGGPSDGRAPRAAMVSGLDGFLYGCANAGGLGNRGTVFRIGEDGQGYTTLRDLETADGLGLASSLALGPDEFFYATTSGGGLHNRGTLFRLDREGSGYEILHHFGQAEIGDGTGPQSPPLFGSDGFIYGATTGATPGTGAIYRIRPDGLGYQVLYRLMVGSREGALPRGPLIESPRGVLWGCTAAGGNGSGVIFRARMDGTDYRVMWSFGRVAGDGSSPQGGLVLDAAGWAMGTTTSGGELGYGQIFRFDPKAIVLRLEIVGANSVLTWDAANEGDELQSAPHADGNPPAWMPQPAVVTQVDSTATAVLPADSAHKIFRVKRP